MTKAIGVANLAASQNALSTSSEVIAPARAGRKRVIVRNNDGSIVIYVGTTTAVSALNGFAIGPGVREEFDYKGDLWAIAASGTPTISIAEEY